MDIVSYILSKKYTDQTVDGLGAIKGAPCTVQSIVDITDGKRVTLAWESNSGVEQTQSFDIMNGEDGDTIEWNQIQHSGTKIAEVVINGSKTNVYAPNGGGGAGGGHTIIDPAGNDMDQEDGLQFTGNVAVSDDSENGKTVINIPQEVVSLTQAQYNALPSSKLTDGKIYCISDSVGGVDGYPPLIYSDEEREIGVWRDGKPLYQKTFELGTLESGQNIGKSLGLVNIDKIFLVMDGSWFTHSGTHFPIPYIHYTSGNLVGILFEVSASDVMAQFRIGSGMSGAVENTILTVRYTKTTDTAGSGIWNGQGGYAHHYSTDEHVIGTWIDGKPLYEIVITTTYTGTNVDSAPVATIPNYNNLLIHIMHGYNNSAKDGTSFAVEMNYAHIAPTEWSNYYWVDDSTGQIKVGSGSSQTIKNPVFILQYTKTTD